MWEGTDVSSSYEPASLKMLTIFCSSCSYNFTASYNLYNTNVSTTFPYGFHLQTEVCILIQEFFAHGALCGFIPIILPQTEKLISSNTVNNISNKLSKLLFIVKLRQTPPLPKLLLLSVIVSISSSNCKCSNSYFITIIWLTASWQQQHKGTDKDCPN